MTLAAVFGHMVNFAGMIFWPLVIPTFPQSLPVPQVRVFLGYGLNYAVILSMCGTIFF